MKQTSKGKSGLQWFTVRKAKTMQDRGTLLDCIEATSLEVAFKWACDKWAVFIARSHDAENKDAPALLLVDPMPEKREPLVIITPSAADVDLYANKATPGFTWSWGVPGATTFSAEK